MISGMENNAIRKCTYCHKPVGNNFKYSYGMPGCKNVFKCGRRWCTLKQKFISRLKQLILRLCKHAIAKVKNG
jgi:hypothetical protein